MPLTSIPPRRWVGTLALAAALGMLLAGQTLLRGRLNDLAFLIFWLICFAFTGLAMGMALLDMRAVRNRTRREQRALLETTIQDIQADATSRRQNPKSEDRRPKEIRRPKTE